MLAGRHCNAINAIARFGMKQKRAGECTAILGVFVHRTHAALRVHSADTTAARAAADIQSKRAAGMGRTCSAPSSLSLTTCVRQNSRYWKRRTIAWPSYRLNSPPSSALTCTLDTIWIKHLYGWF